MRAACSVYSARRVLWGFPHGAPAYPITARCCQRPGRRKVAQSLAVQLWGTQNAWEPNERPESVAERAALPAALRGAAKETAGAVEMKGAVWRMGGRTLGGGGDRP